MLTYQEAEQRVDRARLLLDGLQDEAASAPDRSALLRAVDSYRGQVAAMFLDRGSLDSLQEALGRYGQDGLLSRVQATIRIHPDAETSLLQAQELLLEVDRYLRKTELAASAKRLGDFAARLSSTADEAAAGLKSGQWLLAHHERTHEYELLRELGQMLDSDAGQELQRLSGSMHSADALDWESVQRDLSASPQSFSDALKLAAPEILGAQTGIAGLSDAEASYAERISKQADELLWKIRKARSLRPDRLSISAAVDACLGIRAGRIIDAASPKARKAAMELLGEKRLKDTVKGRLKVCPSLSDQDPAMQQLVTAGERYWLLARASEELQHHAATIVRLSSLQMLASRVRQDLDWFLMPDGEKRDALAASRELERLLESDDAASLLSACDAVMDADACDCKAATHIMQDSSASLTAALIEAVPESIDADDSVAGLTEALAEDAAEAVAGADEIIGTIGKAQTATPDPGPVKAAVSAWRHSKAREALAHVPLDAINEGMHQFQLRDLKDAGYYTVGSVIDAPEPALEAIPGMGSTAFLVQQTAKAYAAYQEKMVKVQLSPDDAGAAADGLLSALATYRATCSAQKQLQAPNPAIDHMIGLKEQAEKLKPDLAWAIMGAEDRHARIEAAGALDAYLKGPEIASVRDCVELVLGARAVDAAEARKELAEDPAGFASILGQLVPETIAAAADTYGLSSGKPSGETSSAKVPEADIKAVAAPKVPQARDVQSQPRLGVCPSAC